MPIVNEVAKSQWVRAYDVLGMVPMQVYIGKTNGDLEPWERRFLVEGGIITGLWNLRNLISDQGKEIKPFPRIPGSVSSVYKRDRSTKRRVNNLRLFVDVMFYGPAMISIAAKRKTKIWEKIFLYSTGITTILVNGANYIANLKEDPLSLIDSVNNKISTLRGLGRGV